MDYFCYLDLLYCSENLIYSIIITLLCLLFFASQDLKIDASSHLQSLYDEIRPAIEEHERDSQDNVATSVAEKWIEVCCMKLKAEFDLHSSIIKNLACTPRRNLVQVKPSEGNNENEVKYLT